VKLSRNFPWRSSDNCFESLLWFSNDWNWEPLTGQRCSKIEERRMDRNTSSVEQNIISQSEQALKMQAQIFRAACSVLSKHEELTCNTWQSTLSTSPWAARPQSRALLPGNVLERSLWEKYLGEGRIHEWLSFTTISFRFISTNRYFGARASHMHFYYNRSTPGVGKIFDLRIVLDSKLL